MSFPGSRQPPSYEYATSLTLQAFDEEIVSAYAFLASQISRQATSFKSPARLLPMKHIMEIEAFNKEAHDICLQVGSLQNELQKVFDQEISMVGVQELFERGNSAVDKRLKQLRSRVKEADASNDDVDPSASAESQIASRPSILCRCWKSVAELNGRLAAARGAMHAIDIHWVKVKGKIPSQYYREDMGEMAANIRPQTSLLMKKLELAERFEAEYQPEALLQQVQSITTQMDCLDGILRTATADPSRQEDLLRRGMWRFLRDMA